MKNLILSMLAITLIWSSLTHAKITCMKTENNESNYTDYTVPVIPSGVTISAMRDLPVGAVLFRQTIQNPGPNYLGFLGCTTDNDGSESASTWVQVNFEGSLPPSVGTWTSGSTIFDTGVVGVGMVLNTSELYTSKIPYPIPYTSRVFERNISPLGSYMSTRAMHSVELLLVKTGDIPAGTWSIPVSATVVVNAVLSSGGIELYKDHGSRLNITGAVNILAGTCQTPDVSVPMGTHDIKNNSASTDWVDFTISLLNCPPMYGRYAGPSERDYAFSLAANQWISTGNIESGPDQSNSVGISLNPVSGYNMLASGGMCAKLTQGNDTAGGACIEIQNTKGDNVLTNSQSNILTDAGLTLLSSSASYQITLKARYGLIAENSGMTPGKADSAVEFTINYQ